MALVATLLPLALVVGLSPLPIMPVVLLLMSARARPNATVYVAAWVVVLTLLVTVATLAVGAADPPEPDDEGIGVILVLTGVVFVVLAAVKWRGRPGPGEAEKTPAWMATVGSADRRQAAGLGAGLAGANPKNLLLAAAAGAEIAALTTTPEAALAGIVGFVVVGSIGVGTPVLVHLALGERASRPLEDARAWLERNGTVLSIAVLAVLGAALLIKGLPALF